MILKENSGCEMKRGEYNLVSPGKERLDLTMIEFGHSERSVVIRINSQIRRQPKAPCSESLEVVGDSVRRHILLNRGAW